MYPTCSEASAGVGEDLAGTACDGVRHWVAVEYRGPWRPKVVVDNDLPAPVAGWLRMLKDRSDTRPVMIRRRGKREGVTVLYADVVEKRVHRFDLVDHKHVANLPWEALFAGDIGLGRTLERPILVCTHGGRDHCCGLHGPALARALDDLAPERAWQCSHLGGHRFAATAVALPEGLHYGRVRAEEAADLLAELDAGRVYRLDRMRGRTHLPVAVQAAEAHMRRQLDLRGLNDVIVNAWSTDGENGDASWHVILQAGDDRRTVQVVRAPIFKMAQGSCGGDEKPVMGWEITEV